MTTAKKIERWNQPRLKFIGVPLQKDMTPNNDGTLLVRGVFTSDNKDETGDIITRAATERAVPKYRQWGNVRRMHMPDPVGVVTRIGVEDGLGWNEVEIKVIDPKAVFEVQNELLKALSVGILVKYDDVDFLEDGGLIINDYTLAEISLVDHPANYDAMLTRSADAQEGVAMLVRSFGMEAVAQSFQTLLDKEIETMDKTLNETVAQVEVPAVEETPEVAVDKDLEETAPIAEVTETPVAEVPADEEPVSAVAEETPVDGDKDLTPDDETPTDEVTVEKNLPTNDVVELLRSLIGKVDSLTEQVSALKANAPEVSAEVQAAPEQPADEDAIAKGVTTTDEPGTPVNRDGGIPGTVLPEYKDLADEKTVYGLRDHIKKYLETHFAQ